MILIESNFRSKYASAVHKSRVEKIRVVRLEPDLYYCARREAGHGQYLVRFFHRGDAVSAVCSTIYNQPCPSTKRDGQCCVHLAAAHESAIRHGLRLQRKERSEAA